MQAPQVEYRVIVEGQQHFDCAPLRATLSTKACALRWNAAREAEEERRDRLISCRRCPVGAAHFEQHRSVDADEKQPHRDPGAPRAAVCVRCGRPATRMVNREVCPSCFNRFREFLKGKNARGNAPLSYVPPRPWRVGVVETDGRHTWRLFEGVSLDEAQARAVRAGYRLHDQHPGRIEWNAAASRFEYRAPDGRILLELENDGRIEFIPVERLHQDEVPAQVTVSVMLMTIEEGAAMLAGNQGLTSDWHQTDLGCRRCSHGVLHTRHYRGAVECRCSAGCS